MGVDAIRIGAAAAALMLATTSACEPRQRPWQGQPDGGVIDESEPFLAPAKDASTWLGDASFADAGADPVPLPLPRSVSRVGGLWVSCYGKFQPTGSPLDAVTKLGLMCGPVNGMQQLGTTFEGSASASASKHTFAVKSGECYRVFAVAAASVDDLDVVVKSGRGTRLSADQTEDRWPIVDPERPLCSFEDDTFVAEVSSRKGRGAFALQVWRLPVEPRK